MQGERPAMRVAVIGLGVMGAGMACHLAEVGCTVTVYNRTRARAEELAPHGVTIAATPRDAAAASEAVILMLADDHATRACTDGPDGVLAGLAPGALVLQMGTLAPETTMALIEACGIDPALYAHVLQGSNLGTRMLVGKANQMVAADYAARFSIANEYKDVGLALQLARSLGLHLRQGESVFAPFEEAMERRLGAQDIAAMRLLVR